MRLEPIAPRRPWKNHMSAFPLEALAGILAAAQDVLLVTHVNPDGDAFGSLCALGLMLRQQGKRVTLACDDGVSARFSYLPLAEAVQDKAAMEKLIAAGGSFDLVVALDCGDEQRLGRAYACLPTPRPAVLNIDHHVTNTYFGQLNIVRPAACATTELLHDLFQALGWVLTTEVAVALLTGLVTDSQSFSTSNVTAHTLEVAGALVAAGADLPTITLRALKLTPLATLRLWQKGLTNMQLADGLLWTSVSAAERREADHASPSSAGLASLLGDVEQAQVGAVLLEMDDGQVTVSWRCRPPYDVSAVAVALGGGGHPQAAGCTLPGPLLEAERRVVQATQAAIHTQKGHLLANGRR